MTETYSPTHIKAYLSEVVEQVENEHIFVGSSRNGRLAVILVSPDDPDAIEDLLVLTLDPQALEEVN